MANLGDISKINLPNGNVVNIKDTTARAQVLKIAKEDTGRNCFNNIATTATKNNITFTVNADKSVTLTATQAASADVYFELGYYTGDGTTRKLMGAPSGSSTSKWWLFGGNGVDDVGSGVNITNSSTIYIIVKSGQTPNNVTFKPMITTQAWLDAVFTEYQPYALPNTKITPELIELVDSGAKNVFSPTITTGVDSYTNLSLTVNSDNTITISGTAQSSKYIVIGRGYTTAGNYVLSGTPSGITVDTGGYMRIEQGGDGVSQVLTPVDITLDNREYVVYLRVLSGKTYNHTISPMLCSKAAWDVSQKYVPYRPTYEETVEQVAENKNNISLLAIRGGGYNFAKIGTNSYTGYGLTLTVDNGTITISGTATGSFSLYLSGTISDSLTADSKLSSQLPTQIAFTGAPDTNSKNRLIFGLYNDSTWVYSGSTNDLYHDLSGKTYNNWLIYLPIVSGNIYNGTWRPMIIDKTVYDSGFTDFQPYAPSNAELYAMIQALQQ